MSSDPNGAWYTGDELKFIERIAEREDRKALDGYRNSIGKRADWARIDREKVIQTIEKLMEQANG